jgi:hypothetical protein
MIGAAKKNRSAAEIDYPQHSPKGERSESKSISPPSLSALWSILLLVVALCLPETRVWGFAATPQPASGVFAPANPLSIGEFTTATAYDVSGSPVAARVTAQEFLGLRWGNPRVSSQRS